MARDEFDPYALLEALERQRVTYIIVGALGRVIHGSDELTDGLDIVPSTAGGEPAPARARTGRAERPPPGRQSARLGARPRDASRCSSSDRRRRAEGRPRAGRHARLRRSPPPRAARAARARPASLGRLARRPRAHARRPRSRAGPPAAPHAAAPARARPRHQPRDRALAGSERFRGLSRVQELPVAIASETQMHQGADPSHRFCTLYGCRAAVSAGRRSCSATRASRRDPVEPRPIIREAGRVERLAYTRSQAAEALGISRSTLNRLLPFLETVELPWGTKLIPVDEVERLLAGTAAVGTKATGAGNSRTPAGASARARPTDPGQARSGQEPRFDRRRSERQRHADGTWRSALVAVDGAGRSAPPRVTLSAGNVLIARRRIATGAGAVSEAEERGGDATPPRRLGSFRGAATAALRLTGSRARSVAGQVVADLGQRAGMSPDGGRRCLAQLSRLWTWAASGTSFSRTRILQWIGWSARTPALWRATVFLSARSTSSSLS